MLYDVVTPSALKASGPTYCAIHGYVVYTKSFSSRNGATVTKVVLVDPVIAASPVKKSPEELARTATTFVTYKPLPALDRILGHNVQLSPVKKEERGEFDSTPNAFVVKPGNGYAINVKFTDSTLSTKSRNVRKMEKPPPVPYRPHFTDIADCVNGTCVNVAAVVASVEEDEGGEGGVVAHVYDASGQEARVVVTSQQHAEEAKCLREAREGTVVILLDHMFSGGFDARGGGGGSGLAESARFTRVLRPWGPSAAFLGTSSQALRDRLATARRPSTSFETLRDVVDIQDEEEREGRLTRMFGSLTDFLKKRKNGASGQETVLTTLTSASSGDGSGSFVKSRSSATNDGVAGNNNDNNNDRPLTFLEDEVEGDAGGGGGGDATALRYDLVTGVDLGFHDGETAVYWSSSAVASVLGVDAASFAKKSPEDRLDVMEETFAMRRAVLKVWKKDEANLIVLDAFLLPRSTNVLPAPSDPEDDGDYNAASSSRKHRNNKRRKVLNSEEEEEIACDAIADRPHPF